MTKRSEATNEAVDWLGWEVGMGNNGATEALSWLTELESLRALCRTLVSEARTYGVHPTVSAAHIEAIRTELADPPPGT